MGNDRIKRPQLERTQSVRNWSNVLGTPPDAQSGAGAAPEQPSADVVSRSVELGYRVVDEYIQRGQRAAEQIRRGTYGTDTLAEDIQDVAARMVRYASDFTAVWLEFLELTRTDGKRRGTGAQASPPTAAAQPAVTTPPPLRARVRLVTQRRVGFCLDLEPLPPRRQLIVHALRPVDAGPSRIEDVGWEPDDDGGTIVVRIGEAQSPGTYRGIIVDAESNRPVGSLTVDVEAASKE